MTLQAWPVLHAARVIVEALSPLSVTTGVADDQFDSALVLDADGLPALPASSTAGVLRSLALRAYGPDWVRDVFGHTGKTSADVRRSRIVVTWGRLHDSRNRPARGEDVEVDTLLRRLGPDSRLTPVLRERVRINEKGVADADGRGKFDRPILPRGARFTFDLQWWSDGSESQVTKWRQLLGLLASEDFRVGGGVNSGLGRLGLVPSASAAADAPPVARFDLRDDADFAAFLEARRGAEGWLVDLAAPWRGHGVREEPIVPPASSGRTWTLEIEPRDLFRIGGTGVPNASTSVREAHQRTLREPIILWKRAADQQRAEIVEAWPIPGSSIKGVLRHRTLYHLARLHGCFVEDATQNVLDHLKAAEIAIFGSAKGKSAGNRGLVAVDDIFVMEKEGVPIALVTMAHNSIDRFTGGVRDGFLFAEELLHRDAPIAVTLRSRERLSTEAERALSLALADLSSGRATLGGGGGRGHGNFRLARQDGSP